ncbi:MAG TPA: hypothetical protein VK563_05380 [Puia sp.]|nr:hypothetical protein [Puia sp.]
MMISGAACPEAGFAQTKISGDSSTSVDAAEGFVNQIFRTVVDSSFTKYYLSAEASPCRFVKFEYDEWVKYALQETVSMDILNALAEKSYNHRKTSSWRQEQLTGAICISGNQIDSILDPGFDLRQNKPSMGKTAGKIADNKPRLKKIIHQRFEKWSRLLPEQRTVFFFSKPLFTDDGQYAILDLDYRCDTQQCGVSATCLFRRAATGWKLIGRKVR